MTSPPELPPEFLELLQRIKGKRSRIVVEHILEHGHVTTEDLETLYGYKHPPRAIRDVREQGVPIKTFRVKDSKGRDIAAYRFGDPEKMKLDRLDGRKIFPKSFKVDLLKHNHSKCSVCQTEFDGRYLQIDHRVPYEVGGDTDFEIVHYMLLCGSCNRTKSWSCQHCMNWLEIHDPQLCSLCYWGSPEKYEHIALELIRRVDITWAGEDEVALYEQLKQRALSHGIAVAEYIKLYIEDRIN